MLKPNVIPSEAIAHLASRQAGRRVISPTAKSQEPTANRQPPITNTHINIGTGKEISIKELAETIKEIVGFKGDFHFNTDKPDGTLRKLTDSTKLNELGWKYKVELEEGINRMYEWYLSK